MLSFHGVSSFEFHFWLKSNGFAFLPHSMFPTSSQIFNYSYLDISILSSSSSTWGKYEPWAKDHWVLCALYFYSLANLTLLAFGNPLLDNQLGCSHISLALYRSTGCLIQPEQTDIHHLVLKSYRCTFVQRTFDNIFTTASGWDLSCCLSSLLPLSALNFYLKLLFWLLLLLSDPFLHPSHLQTRQLPLSNPILPPHRTLTPNIWEIINMVNLIFTQKYFSSALVSFWIYLTVSEITKPILIGFLLLVCIKWSYVFSQSAPSNKHTANLACLKI